MNRAHQAVVVLSVGLLLVAVSEIFAQDWPQWRGMNRGGRVRRRKSREHAVLRVSRKVRIISSGVA